MVMNQTTLIGRLTADPVVRNTKPDGTGKAVANFTVAVNRMKNNEQITKFIKVVAWGNLAASTSALTKGTAVVVIGEFDDTPQDFCAPACEALYRSYLMKRAGS